MKPFDQDESPHVEQYIDKMGAKDFDESLGKNNFITYYIIKFFYLAIIFSYSTY